MDQIFRRIITEFHAHPIPRGTRRAISLARIERKADCLIGMRRTGKTWFQYQEMNDLLDRGRPKATILYVNFEDERLAGLGPGDLHELTDSYYRLYPALRNEKCDLFLDEIHAIPGWEQFARRLIDSHDVRLCLTGSSAKLLGSEIATAMRGRALVTEVFPFSFQEHIEHRAACGSPVPPVPGESRRSHLENAFLSYLSQGGFPEIQGQPPQICRRILQSYLDVVILRDIVERHGATNILALRHIIRHLIQSPGGRFTVTKFHRTMASRGIRIGRETVYEYLDHLEEAYLFFPVYIHTESEKVRQLNPRKIYAVDTGLVRACSRRMDEDTGHMLENLVFIELRRRGMEAEYYRTSSGREVDFVAGGAGREPMLVQVCVDLQDEQTRAREVGALDEAMAELGIGSGTVISMFEETTLEAGRGRIDVVPAWRWLGGSGHTPVHVHNDR